MPASKNFELRNTNKPIVEAIEKNARSNIELTLDGVFDFFNNHKPEYNPQYKVFNEQFVLCWAFFVTDVLFAKNRRPWSIV